MNRARTALADILGDRSAYDLLDDDYDRVPLTIWCLRSRTDPSFTWQQALETPYLSEWTEGPPGPPTTAAPPAGGANGAGSASSKKRTAPANGPSSAQHFGLTREEYDAHDVREPGDLARRDGGGGRQWLKVVRWDS